MNSKKNNYKKIYKHIQRLIPHDIKYALASRKRRRSPPYSMIRPGWTAFQIGCSGRLCNLGRSQAIVLSSLVGKQGHVYAFEAIPENLSAFEEYIKLHNIENITIVPIGLWNKAGVIEFYVPQKLPNIITTGSRPKQIRENEPSRFDSTRCLPVETIDKMVDKLGIKKVHFINITTNGSEPEIIEGGLHTIIKHRPYITMPGETQQISERITEILTDIGYEVHKNIIRLHILGKPFKEQWAEHKY